MVAILLSWGYLLPNQYVVVIVGYLVAGLNRSIEEKESGIMDLMIKELDAISREKGWSKQGLGVWPNNERAIRAYERLGFYKDGQPLQSRSRPGQLYQPMFRHLPS
ncbi:MAG: hypothetical protein RIT18_1290 [Actinomycetota bacterium]